MRLSPLQGSVRSRCSAALATLIVLIFVAPAAAQDDTPFVSAAPAPVVTDGPRSPDNDRAPRWSFSASDVATGFECSLARDETMIGDWGPCSSPVAYDLTSQPDGVYRFAVRALAADGQPSEVATAEYRLDTSVPALPAIVALPGPASMNRRPEWTFTGGAGEHFECRVARGTELLAEWSECQSPHQVDLSGEADGSFVFSVRGVAENGVRGPARTDGYLLDTEAPAAPAVPSPPAPLDNTRAPALSFAAEDGTQVECRAEGGGADTGWSACSSPYEFDLSGHTDGAHTLSLRATDAAGNTGPAATAAYMLDTTPPDAPAVAEPATSPATRLQPGFAFAAGTGDSHECRLDGPGGYATGWRPCVAPAPYDLTGQPDGVYTFAVRSTDAAGNTGESGSATYDLARNPQAVDLRAGPGRTGRSRQPQWSFGLTGGSRFVCGLDFGTTVLFKPATCGSPRSYSLSGKPDGTYTFTVRAFAADGSEREPATQEYQLDSTPPARPAVTAAPVSPAADTKPGWRFNGDDGAALDCRVSRGQDTVVDWTSCTNPRRFELGQADGDYRVTVRARDAAGNVGPTATSDYRLDTTPPAEPTVKAAPKPDDIDRSPTWTFAAETGARLTCTLTRGSDVVAARTACADAKTYNLSGAQPGTYTFTVEATDAAGNKGPARSARYVLAAAPATRPTGGSGSGGGATGSVGAGGAGGGDTAGGATGSGSDATGRPSAQDGANQPQATGGSRVPASSSGARTGAVDQPGAGRPAADTASPSAQTTRASDADAGHPADGGSSTAGGGDRGQSARADRTDRDGGVGDALTGGARDAARDVARALTGDAARKVFPISVLVLVGCFLLVQNRIDRSDPKLAVAPIDSDPDL